MLAASHVSRSGAPDLEGDPSSVDSIGASAQKFVENSRCQFRVLFLHRSGPRAGRPLTRHNRGQTRHHRSRNCDLRPLGRMEGGVRGLRHCCRRRSSTLAPTVPVQVTDTSAAAPSLRGNDRRHFGHTGQDLTTRRADGALAQGVTIMIAPGIPETALSSLTSHRQAVVTPARFQVRSFLKRRPDADI